MSGSRSLFQRFVRDPLHELWSPPKGQIPALDALRTCAVLFVICTHAMHAYMDAGGRQNVFANLPFVRGGFIGVDLFFVLSGYFIGKQLWREARKTKTVGIKRFMLRRGFRIWPLYFAFFFGVVLLSQLGVDTISKVGPFPWGHWWSDVVFLTNYIPKGIVMGSWSLCTEEQFYLLAPTLLAIAAPRLASIGQCRKYLWAMLAAFPLIRAATWWSLTHDFSHHEHALFLNHIYCQFHTHADGLVMGLILSNVEVETGDAHKKGFVASVWMVLLSLVAVLGLQKLQREIFDFTGITLFFGAITWYLLSHRPRVLSFLDSKVFYVLSRLSFGMYLNHEYAAGWVARFTLANVPFAERFPALHNMAAAAILTALSAAFAVVTFALIEHPFLEMRTAILDRKPASAPTPKEEAGLAA